MRIQFYFSLLFIAALAHAEGPQFVLKDNLTQREFTNAYQDIRKVRNEVTIIASSVTAISSSVATLVSSQTAANVLFTYHRPYLTWIDSNTVSLSANSSTTGYVQVAFPDGNIRGSSNASAIQGSLAQTAILGQSGLQGGIRAGESRTTDQWYSVYVVKSTDSASLFTVVLTSVSPVVSNLTVLNTAFVANSWLYVGTVRNGDRSGATNTLLQFVQSGPVTLFYNVAAAGSTGLDGPGILMANQTGAASGSYTYSSGVGSAQIPTHFLQVIWTSNVNMATPGLWQIRQASSTAALFYGYSTGNAMASAWIPATQGVAALAASPTNFNLYLAGFYDNVLAAGVNSQF